LVGGNGSSPGREQMGGGGRRTWVGWLAVEDKEGAPWGAEWRRARPFFFASSSCFAAALCMLCAGRRKEKRRGRKEKEERKGKKKRGKIYWEIFET
jgi:hypothetical protein